MQKLWIYTLSKQLTSEQEIDFNNRCETFVKSWTAHDISLDASFELYKHRLLIFKVDETKYGASGCSIDKQLRFVKELEQAFSLELLNRLLVAYDASSPSATASSPSAANETIEVVKASDIKNLLVSGMINKDTLIFDNTITTSEELLTIWKKPLHQTYLAKYLVV